MKKVKVGIIGCGFMAQVAHIPCLAASENAEIVALCDFRDKITEELCRRHGIPRRTDSAEEMMSMDIDAVYVLTPVEWHLHNIKQALKAGKHVFTEKPAAMSEESAGVLKKEAEQSGLTVMAGYMKRHDANLAEYIRLRNECDWGGILFARVHSFIGSQWNAAISGLTDLVSSDEPADFGGTLLDPGPSWLEGGRGRDFYSFGNPYYALLDTGCHSVNLLRFLAGREPDVSSSKSYGAMRLTVFDFGDFPGTLEFAINIKNMKKWDETAEIYFEKATVKIAMPAPLDMQSSAEVGIYSEDGELQRDMKLEDNRKWAFKLQTESFLRKVMDGESFSNLEDAQKDAGLIEKIFKMENRQCG